MKAAESGMEVHILGPVDDAEAAAKTLLDRVARDAVVLDLSAGQLMTPHPLRERLQAAGAIPEGVRWINAQERFADHHAEDSRQAYIRWLAAAADQPMAGGRSVKELFDYEGQLSLWWFAPMAVKQAEHHPYRWLFYMIAVVRSMKEQHTGATWHLWMPDVHTVAALEKVLRGEKTRSHVVSDAPASWRTRRLIRSLHLVWRAGREVLRILAAAWQSREAAVLAERTADEGGGDRGKGRILFQTYFPQSWADVPEYERPDPRVRRHDRYFGDAPWRLKQAGFDVRWMPQIGDRSHKKKWQKALSRQTLPGAKGTEPLDWKQAFSLIDAMLRWTARYLWYFDVKSVQRQWRYEGIPLGHWLAAEMRELAVGGWRRIRQMQWYRSVGEALEPDAVLYRNEFYAEGRVVSAALKGRTTLIGVQHGLIGWEHPVYQFDSSEIASEAAPEEVRLDFVHHCPVPDVFAAFGERFVELFEEWDGFPASRVEAVGGLRHDALMERYGNLAEEEQKALRERFNLPTNRPVILLCTGIRSLVAGWTEMTLRAAETVPEAFLAVKLHQYHGGEARAHAVVEERGFASYRVFREGIYPLIAACDVVIGGGSTVLIEAGLLGTPAVALTPSCAYQHYDFEDATGLMQRAADGNELAEALRAAVEREEATGTKAASEHMANAEEKASVAMERLIEST